MGKEVSGKFRGNFFSSFPGCCLLFVDIFIPGPLGLFKVKKGKLEGYTENALCFEHVAGNCLLKFHYVTEFFFVTDFGFEFYPDILAV
jgi:hypothetical protein